jgi:hypothetical protein
MWRRYASVFIRCCTLDADGIASGESNEYHAFSNRDGQQTAGECHAVWDVFLTDESHGSICHCGGDGSIDTHAMYPGTDRTVDAGVIYLYDWRQTSIE